jgi:AbrB family looped-hinge helix DNA binding protein
MSAPKSKFPNSKITAQGQISVPADIRKKLGVGPGSILEWVEEDGRIIVKRASGVSFEDIHKTLFPKGPPSYVADPRKAGIDAHVRKKYGRR